MKNTYDSMSSVSSVTSSELLCNNSTFFEWCKLNNILIVTMSEDFKGSAKQ